MAAIFEALVPNQFIAAHNDLGLADTKGILTGPKIVDEAFFFGNMGTGRQAICLQGEFRDVYWNRQKNT